MKPIVIYHGNCADGFTAAWCFYSEYRKNNYDFYAADYNSPPPPVHGRQVFLVDFCYSKDDMELMSTQANHITVLDHHVTTQKTLAAVNWHCPHEVNLDMNRSGAMIAWQYVSDKPAPMMLRYVQDRDLLRFNMPNSKAINAFIYSHPYEFDTWTTLMSMPVTSKEVHMGEGIVHMQQKTIEALYDSRRYVTIGGVSVPTMNVPYNLGSDACAYMLACEPTVLFAAYYYDSGDDRIYGLRSSKYGADVAAIAEAYGGGGHVHASGFRIKLGTEGQL